MREKPGPVHWMSAVRSAQANILKGLAVTGEGLDKAAKFVRQHQPALTATTRDACDTIGQTTQRAGESLTRLCDEKAVALRAERMDAGSSSDLTINVAVCGLLNGGGAIGRSMRNLGAATRRASPTVGAATGGLVAGTVSAVSGAVDSIALSDEDFARLEERLIKAGKTARTLSQAQEARLTVARQTGQYALIADTLTIGGVTVSEMLMDSASVPADVERAFTLAYPDVAAHGENFTDVASRLSGEGLVGLVSGVKGKLFEINLVDNLNNELLESGAHAELATSVTQPGYDIRIYDAKGDTIDLLQAKATDAVAHVREAIERYPTIDISTTSEVHGKLMTLGLSDHVTDSGISNAVLQHKVESAAGLGGPIGLNHFAPSALGLAIIACLAFSNRDASWEERGAAFGDRAAKATVAGVAVQGVLVATNLWWLALASGLGLRVLSERGSTRRQRYDALHAMVETLETENRVIDRPLAPHRLSSGPSPRRTIHA